MMYDDDVIYAKYQNRIDKYGKGINSLLYEMGVELSYLKKENSVLKCKITNLKKELKNKR